MNQKTFFVTPAKPWLIFLIRRKSLSERDQVDPPPMRMPIHYTPKTPGWRARLLVMKQYWGRAWHLSSSTPRGRPSYPLSRSPRGTPRPHLRISPVMSSRSGGFSWSLHLLRVVVHYLISLWPRHLPSMKEPRHISSKLWNVTKCHFQNDGTVFPFNSATWLHNIFSYICSFAAIFVTIEIWTGSTERITAWNFAFNARNAFEIILSVAKLELDSQ